MQTVAFDTLSYQQGEIRWVSDSTVDIELAGLYLLTASYILGNSGANISRTTQIRRNAGVAVASVLSQVQTAGLAVSTVVDAALGDQIIMEVTGDGVAPILAGPGFTTLTVTRIGPVRWT